MFIIEQNNDFIVAYDLEGISPRDYNIEGSMPMRVNFYLNPYFYKSSFAQKCTPQHPHNFLGLVDNKRYETLMHLKL
jgi:hypothetical protein